MTSKPLNTSVSQILEKKRRKKLTGRQATNTQNKTYQKQYYLKESAILNNIFGSSFGSSLNIHIDLSE